LKTLKNCVTDLGGSPSCPFWERHWSPLGLYKSIFANRMNRLLGIGLQATHSVTTSLSTLT